jgi:hypothetical protein
LVFQQAGTATACRENDRSAAAVPPKFGPVISSQPGPHSAPDSAAFKELVPNKLREQAAGQKGLPFSSA